MFSASYYMTFVAAFSTVGIGLSQSPKLARLLLSP
jgi:hypothetical protein